MERNFLQYCLLGIRGDSLLALIILGFICVFCSLKYIKLLTGEEQVGAKCCPFELCFEHKSSNQK